MALDRSGFYEKTLSFQPKAPLSLCSGLSACMLPSGDGQVGQQAPEVWSKGQR